MWSCHAKSRMSHVCKGRFCDVSILVELWMHYVDSQRGAVYCLFDLWSPAINWPGTIATATLQFSLEMGARAAKPNGAWNVFGELNQWKRLRANCTFRKRFMLVWTLPREVYFEPVRRYTKLEPCPCTVKSQFACSSCLGTFLYLSQSN